MTSTNHSYRKRGQRVAWRAHRVLSALLLALTLAGGFLTNAPVQSAAAAGANGKAFTAYRGKMREVYRTGSGRVIFKTYHNNGTFQDIDMGFDSPAIPALADNPDDTFLIVFARGQDNALWFNTIAYDNGFSGWRSLGGIFYDDPAAFTNKLGNAKVSAAVTGTDGQRYERSTGDSHNFLEWTELEKGRYVPLGTNILSGDNASGGQRLGGAHHRRHGYPPATRGARPPVPRGEQ